jgi:hypothetical protein
MFGDGRKMEIQRKIDEKAKGMRYVFRGQFLVAQSLNNSPTFAEP